MHGAGMAPGLRGQSPELTVAPLTRRPACLPKGARAREEALSSVGGSLEGGRGHGKKSGSPHTPAPRSGAEIMNVL